MKNLYDLDFFVNKDDETNKSRTEYFEPPEYVVKPHENDNLFKFIMSRKDMEKTLKNK